MGFIEYEQVEQAYLDRRRLRPSAGWKLLWAMGVGAVISGDFAGWNLGLPVAGFWGFVLSTLIVATMYVCMVFSIAELSASLPFAGGFFSFARHALGPFGGFVCGMTDVIEYVLSPAVIVYFIAEYMQPVFPGVSPPVWWIVFYVLFVGINVWGAGITFRVGLMVTLVALAVLIGFFASVLWTGAFDSELLFNIPAETGRDPRGLTHGWPGVLLAMPFAIWLFLGIEQLPVAAEETHDVVRDMPKALVWSLVTLLVLGLATVVLNSGVGGGAVAIGRSGAPLNDGFLATLGHGYAPPWFLSLAAVAGLVASFHSLIYAYGRVLFALSRAGYIPRWLSLTTSRHTPGWALVAGGVVGLGCTFLLHQASGTGVGSALLNMAVFGAVISYTLVMVSFIKLRITQPDLPRPYRSPLGVPGAVVGAVVACFALSATMLSPDYLPAVLGVALFLAVAIVYFWLYSRRRLVAQAPEEEVALLQAAERELHGDAPDMTR
ncbi:MAG: ethanolamine permease [Planctomycetia bacterium]|nr:ethanolamine permease [Planctomycetia bacterium]